MQKYGDDKVRMYGTLLQKGLEKLSTENFCRAILSGQNDDMLYDVGLLCLRIQEIFELEAL